MADKLLIDQDSQASKIRNFITNSERVVREGYRSDYEARQILLDRYWSQFCNNDIKLRDYANQEIVKVYKTKDKFTETELDYTKAMSWLLSHLQPHTPSILSPVSNREEQRPPNFYYCEKVKLPRFSGLQKDWDAFKAKFSSLVLEDKSLSKTIKFQQLVNSLDGSAADIIKGFELTGEKFDGAWQQLCSTYDNKSHRFFAHMTSLVSLPKANRETLEHLSLLLTTSNQCISVFLSMNYEVNHWDPIMIFLLESKLSNYTRREWLHVQSLQLDRNATPTFALFKAFLENRIREMNTLGTNGSEKKVDTESKTKPVAGRKNINQTSIHATSSKVKTKSKTVCPHCQKGHFIAYCQAFKRLPIKERKQVVSAKRLCFNCLNGNNLVEQCTSTRTCTICAAKHHSLLHNNSPSAVIEPAGSSTIIGLTATSNVLSNMSTSSRNLLATAMVVLENPQGGKITVRALLDSCAEQSLITERVAQSLSLPRLKANTYLTGSGGTTAAIARHKTSLLIKSELEPAFQLNVTALILQRVTNCLKGSDIDYSSWPHLKGLSLADPNFHRNGQVDCILSSFVYGQVMKPEIIRPDNTSLPVALNSIFGWVLVGSIPQVNYNGSSNVFVNLTVDHTLSKAVEKFWEVEEVPTASLWSPEEQQCFDHFQKTHTRDHTGRFVVCLPFKSPPQISKSKEIAFSCYKRLEKKLQFNHDLKTKYADFMSEYKSLGHLKMIKEKDQPGYFLPHHAVIKKETGKIRVVFNASQKGAYGFSLNDYMHVGPKLHVDIVTILIRWAFFRYVFTLDIVKMFRQFQVCSKDQKWQQIFWRWGKSQPVAIQKLTTVTYGTAAAPFLANACLLQLAKEADKELNEAAKAIELNRYVDDFFVGADSIDKVEETRNNLIKLLASAGMTTDKYAANYSGPNKNEAELTSINIPVNDIDTVSLLGLNWDPKKDQFCYKFKLEPLVEPITKRSILSKVASLYDPVGWLCPIVIRAKIILQQLWIQGYDWDAALSPNLRAAWVNFYPELSIVHNIVIPRWLGTEQESSWTIHGFADASQLAYGVAIFVVAINNGVKTSQLVLAKSKVTPIKTINVPRLELCAALLLAKSIKYLLSVVQTKPKSIICWSDSRTVLSWLNSPPASWKTFVANRVSEIMTLIPQVPWHHVRTNENPADVASRGCAPGELINNLLWWKGPAWLIQDETTWPIQDQDAEALERAEMEAEEEAKPFDFKWICTTQTSWSVTEWIQRFSDINTPVAIFAHCLRWAYRIRRYGLNTDTGHLTAVELLRARMRLIAWVQREVYPQEVSSLVKGQIVAKQSLIRQLSPFVGADGLLRAQGRLEFSHLSEDEKHPIILPHAHHLTLLLIREAHAITLHGGTSLVHGLLARRYWITKGRSTIRKVVRSCVKCVRHNSSPETQKMAPLPVTRATPSRPFSYTGLDYAGPFLLRRSPGRGSKSYKGYVAIFICLAVKAVHFELVSDYTTSSFMAALRRFVARRGAPKIIYSDNGTTFQGASTELRKLFHPSTPLSQECATRLAQQGVEWSFIPPRAPNFGGLWEANIKSFKGHLRKVIGVSKLTFEEFTTLSNQIEACLNSRPMSPVYSEHDAPVVLTPGHFLIGEPLVGIPSPGEPHAETYSYKTRWEWMQSLLSHFWKRWSREYLLTLQARSKWLLPNRTLQLDDIVIIKDELLPATQWLLGKVIQLYEGKDGLCRSVRLRTTTSELVRPLNKLILLPTNDLASSFYSSL